MAVICKWMGGWSYRDYRACPVPLRAAIIGLIDEEQERYRNA